MLRSSNSKFESVRFLPRKNSGAWSTLKFKPSPSSRRGCWCCTCKQSIGYWSSPSFLVEDVWEDRSILIARSVYWVLIWISQCIFSLWLNLADNAWHYSFSAIEDSFYLLRPCSSAHANPSSGNQRTSAVYPNWYWSESHNAFFRFCWTWQCLKSFFFRNRGQILWFGSSRNESNNILDEHCIAFFLSGE